MQVRYIYCFCSFTLISASIRYRSHHVLQELEKTHGVRSVIVHPGHTFRNVLYFTRVYLSVLLFRKKNSVIIFQKIYANNLYARALKFLAMVRKTNTLYDTDDADHLRYPAHNMHYFMRTCSDCAVGSDHLMNYVHTFNRKVAHFTSPVIGHSHIKDQPNKKFTIGWVGEYNSTGPETDFSHVVSLNKLAFPAIRKLDFPCTLLLLGVTNDESAASIKKYFADNSNIEVLTPMDIDWLDEEQAYARISTFDVGLAPLVDHELNQAKSAFKLKQYLSCGVPALASPVGENKKFLDHGENGYLCSTPEEFYEGLLKLKQLAKEDYSVMSRNAHAQTRNFSVKKYANEFLAYYQAK